MQCKFRIGEREMKSNKNEERMMKWKERERGKKLFFDNSKLHTSSDSQQDEQEILFFWKPIFYGV